MMYKTIKLESNEDITKKSVYNNVIRSILYRNMPGYGVKIVDIIKNTSEYENVYLCDRIQQIPFKKEGVYSLKSFNVTQIYTNDFDNQEGVYKDILILNQATPVDFEVIVTVVKNTGYQHIKYCPIQLVKYDLNNDISITMLDYIEDSNFKQTLLSLVQ